MFTHLLPAMSMLLCCLLPLGIQAQNTESKGWLFLSHTQKLSPHWDVLTEGQVRSTHRLHAVNTLLLRAAVSYNFTTMHSVAAGYTYKGDWEHDGDNITYQPERRIYEQYLLAAKLHTTELTARIRAEQRFLKQDGKQHFAQRARAYVNVQVPLVANTKFTKGMYAKLQDEIFVNVQNKEFVNNDFFDQNRLQGGIGYRWSKHIDTDINYMFWRQKEMDGYVSSNVFVIMITTEL